MSTLLLKDYIKKVLNENKEIITEINIFDFDDTLFRSIDKPKDWNTKKQGFWWNDEKSLNSAYYDQEMENYWIESTIKKVIESNNNQNAITILCTARHDRPEIRFAMNELLRNKGLSFDAIYLKPLKSGISTPHYKANTVKTLLNSYSYASSIHFWEDNQDNLNAVQDFIDRNNKLNPKRQIEYYPHLVL